MGCSASPPPGRFAADLPPPGGGEERFASAHTISIAAASLAADPEGALYWPDHGLLAVSDLHLEKGSSYAARGQFLPPYDTAATLARLGKLISRYSPRCVVALGDSFHDGGGPARLAAEDRDSIAAMSV